MALENEKLFIKTPFYGKENIYNGLGKPYPINEAKNLLEKVKPLLIDIVLMRC